MENPKISTNQYIFKEDGLITYVNGNELISEITSGLLAERKYISSRFFYDDRGSLLFEEITGLPEYYPTRTEKSILKKIAPEITENAEDIDIIELGSGDSSKISILFDSLPKEKYSSVRYIPVDVSKAVIMKSAETLSFKYPGLKIKGLQADFMKYIHLPGENPHIAFYQIF